MLAAVLWASLVIRYGVKLRKGKAAAVVVTALGLPLAGFFGALAKWGSVWFAAVLVSAAAALPWISTGFRPELMLDADLVFDENEITEEIVNRTQNYQLRAIAILVLVVLVLAVVFWDDIPV